MNGRNPWRARGWLAALLALLSPLTSLAQAAPIRLDPVRLDAGGERWARTTLRRMTLEEKVGQLIMVWAHVAFLNVADPEYTGLLDAMRRYHVGGFGITVGADETGLIKGQPLEAAFLTNALQRHSRYPLIMAADFERGIAMRLGGATDFPAAMAFGAAADPALARDFGRVSALESRAVGIQWNWFPIADVNSNPANPIINTRSFGEDPAKVSEMVDAYIRGARSAGLLTTVKHFPGHGDTDTDSHIGLARVTASMDRLQSLELVPFRNAIDAGVDSVMVGHITVPAIEPDANRPASVSPRVVTDLLRGRLGFRGLVVTDALDMNGLKRVFPGTEAEIAGAEAVAAVEAGDDMVIIPGDLEGAYTGLLNAVKNGTIPVRRIDQSVLRILRMKASVGLNRSRLVDLASVPEAVARPESMALAQQIAERAVTLVSDPGSLVPLRAPAASALASAPGPEAPAGGMTAVVFGDSARGSEGSRAFAGELRARIPGIRLFRIDQGNARFLSPEVLSAVRGAERVIVLAESVPNPRRTTQGREGGSVALDAGPADLLAGIVAAAGVKTVVAAFGNPYVGMGVAGIQAYLCTFSNTASSARALVRALFGEIPIRGRLPVTLPGMAPRGAGLDRPRTPGQAAPGTHQGL